MDKRDGFDVIVGGLSLALLGTGLLWLPVVWYGMYGATVLAWFGK